MLQQLVKKLRGACQIVLEKIIWVLKLRSIFLNIYSLLAIYFIVSGISFFEFLSLSSYVSIGQLECLLISMMALSVCPNNARSKSLLVSLCIYLFYILITDQLFTNVSSLQWSLEILFFFSISLFQMIKGYNFVSDSFNKENVFILMYKPKKTSEYISTLFGYSVSSMSIVAGDDWYMYKRKLPTLCKRKVLNRNLKDYVLIDTGVKITQNITKELDSLVGTNARSMKTLYLRGRCVSTFKCFLGNLGDKWKLRAFDSIPSIYMLRRLKSERSD